MRRICLLLMVLGGSWCLAQNAEAPKEPPKFYKLDFVVKDLDGGKVITSRNYSIVVKADNSGRGIQIRAGSKVPIGGEPLQYVDVGTSIDCSYVVELHDGLSLQLVAEVSSVLAEGDPHPVIRQNKWNSNVVVPLRKSTVVFSSDDSTTKRVMELEVTATPRT